MPTQMLSTQMPPIQMPPIQMLSSAPTSALARPIDFRHSSNRTAVYGLLAFSTLALLTGRNWRQALGVGGVAFVGWATGRELDPDEPLSATLALGLAGLVGLGQSIRGDERTAPAVLPGAVAMIAARVVSATVGAAPSQQDTLALSAQAGIAALAGYPVAALLPAGALALSAKQQDRWSTAV